MVCGCWLHMVLRSLENSQTQALACKQASGTAQPLPPRCFRVAAYDHAYVGPKGSATCSAPLTSGPLPAIAVQSDGVQSAPASNHGMPVPTSDAHAPVRPSMAKRPWMISRSASLASPSYATGASSPEPG